MEYKRKIIPFNIKKTDNLAVILFFVTFVPFGIINLVDKRTPLLSTGSVWFDSLIAFGMFIVGMLLHEALHALSGMIFGKEKKEDISFGFELKEGNLYTHFLKPMTVKAYALTLITPCILTGLVPIALTTAFAGPILIAPAALLFAGCTGDIVMFFSLRKCPEGALIADHPTALAYYLCYPEDALPEGFSEETEEEEKESLKDSVSPPFESEKAKKKSIFLKCLGIMAFIALYVLMMYLISILMKNI